MIDAPLRALPATDVDDGADGDAARPSFEVTSRGARLRFDLSALSPNATIARAVLSLREAEGPPRRGAVTLRARALLARWRSGGDDATPRSESGGVVTLAEGARGPVRIDVTEALREGTRWGAVGGIVLEAEGATLRVEGPWSTRGAPALEVAAR